MKTTITENCILLNLEFSMLGNTRKVHTSEIDAGDADKALLRVSKHLFDSPEYKEIGSFMGELSRWVKDRALPSYFKRGIYLTPITFIKEIEDELENAARSKSGMTDDSEVRQLPALLADFKKAYPRLVAKSIERLGKLAKEADYPPVNEIEKYFAIEWKWLNVEVPNQLKSIDAKLFEIEREKARKQWTEAADQIQTLLRQNLAELLDRMVERLTPEPNGDKKKFKNSTVETLQEFMELFDRRNVVDDKMLAGLVAKARKVMNGVDAESLREFDGTRERVKNVFTAISSELSSVVKVKSRREISFED